MKLNPILMLALTLPILSAGPTVAQDTAVRMAEPVFAKQPDWAVEKYGGPGLFFPEKGGQGTGRQRNRRD